MSSWRARPRPHAHRNLAAIRYRRGATEEAEALYRRALAIKHTVLGPDHPELAILLNNLAVLAPAREDKAHARLLYQRAIALLEPAVSGDHPTLHGCRQALLALMDIGPARGETPPE